MIKENDLLVCFVCPLLSNYIPFLFEIEGFDIFVWYFSSVSTVIFAYYVACNSYVAIHNNAIQSRIRKIHVCVCEKERERERERE